jgi:hypothetical protein
MGRSFLTGVPGPRERFKYLEAVIAESGLAWSEIPREALFLAGKAFLSCRKEGGQRMNQLLDSLIGAHASPKCECRSPRTAKSYLPRLGRLGKGNSLLIFAEL